MLCPSDLRREQADRTEYSNNRLRRVSWVGPPGFGSWTSCNEASCFAPSVFWLRILCCRPTTIRASATNYRTQCRLHLSPRTHEGALLGDACERATSSTYISILILRVPRRRHTVAADHQSAGLRESSPRTEPLAATSPGGFRPSRSVFPDHLSAI